MPRISFNGILYANMLRRMKIHNVLHMQQFSLHLVWTDFVNELAKKIITSKLLMWQSYIVKTQMSWSVSQYINPQIPWNSYAFKTNWNCEIPLELRCIISFIFLRVQTIWNKGSRQDQDLAHTSDHKNCWKTVLSFAQLV